MPRKVKAGGALFAVKYTGAHHRSQRIRERAERQDDNGLLLSLYLCFCDCLCHGSDSAAMASDFKSVDCNSARFCARFRRLSFNINGDYRFYRVGVSVCFHCDTLKRF